MAKLSKLNCIDLSCSVTQSSVALLKQTCLDSGFFYVTNHGIDEEFIDEVFSQSKKFFSLPMEEKMKLLRNQKNRRHAPVFDELMDPVNQIHDILPAWRETMEKYHHKALSALHRVLTDGQERYSIVFFVEPNHDCLVQCLPTCHSENNPPKFPPIKCQYYLLQRYKETYADLNSYR